MTVAELKAALNQYPDEMLVYVRGYEGGVNDLDRFEVNPIRRDQNKEWYYGTHEVQYEGQSEEILSTDVKGLLVS